MPPDFNDLFAAQKAFTQAIRNPKQMESVPGISADKLKVYQNLFYNNVSDTLDNAFPIINKILPAQLWTKLKKRFFREHHSHTPEFPRFPYEFVCWLDNKEHHEDEEPDFLVQLALWEWTEIDVLMDNSDISKQVDSEVDFLKHKPVVNPSIRLFSFDYPVHQISTTFLPHQKLPQAIYLVAYRNSEHQVKYEEMSAASAILMNNLIESGHQTGQQQIEHLSSYFTDLSQEQLTLFVLEFLQTMLEKGIVMGTCR